LTDDIVSWCKTRLQKRNTSSRVKTSEGGNSLGYKTKLQWTPTGAGPVVHEEEEEEEEDVDAVYHNRPQ